MVLCATNAVIVQGGTPAPSGDGDLVYAENLTSSIPVEGDKVLLNLQQNYDTHMTDFMNPGSYTGTVFILHNNDVNYTRGYSSRSYLRRWIDGELVNVRDLPNLLNGDLHSPKFIVGDEVCYGYSTNSIYRYNMRTGSTLSSNSYYFTDNLRYVKSSGIIYNRDGSESYTIPNGAVTGTDIVINYNDNCLAVCSKTKTILVDCSNFPDCTSKVYTTNYNDLFGVTGGSVGDYVIGSNTAQVLFQKITETGLSTEFIVDTPTRDSGYHYAQYLNTEKIFTTMNLSNQMVIYAFDSDLKIWSPVNVPDEVQKQFVEDYEAWGTDKGFQISTNSRLEVFGWCLSKDTYDHRTRVMQVADGVSPYLMDNEKVNYDSISTVTAFATGSTDEEGRYEVKTVLPNTLTATITITPNPDSYDVKGAI